MSGWPDAVICWRYVGLMEGIMNPAASERKRKEKSPEKFCPNSRCLWRRASGPCPRHQSEARNQLSQDAREGYGDIRREDAVDEMREVQRDLEQEHDRG